MNSWANLTAACPKSWDKLKLFCENDKKSAFHKKKPMRRWASAHNKEPDI